MFLPYVIILICTFTSIYSKSFTIVIDTTQSMQDDMEIIKANIGTVMYNFINETDIEDFIVVPFKTPEVGTPLIASSAIGLMENIKSLKTKGGVKCPENSVAGIKKALEISKPGSLVYVFTDAYAQEYGNVNEITDLCQSKFSQVVIFLSGVCNLSRRSRTETINVYYDIVEVCSGAVLRLDYANYLRQVFPFMKELNRIDWNDVTTHSRVNGYNELMFNINTYTKEFMVAVSGDWPQVQILTNQGKIPTMDKIVHTKNTQVLKLVAPEVGDYTVIIRCRATSSVSFFRSHDIPFDYGFSTKRPRSLLETSLRPMPDNTNFVLICSKDPTLKLHTLEFTDGRMKTVMNLEETEKQGVYLAQVFVESEKTYRILVRGLNTVTNQEISDTTKLVLPQKPAVTENRIMPTAKIIEEQIDVLEYGDNLTVACKVRGYPKPKIQWEDDNGQTLMTSEDVLLEIPSVYISYLTMINVAATLKIYCKCENDLGEATDSIDVQVKRSFIFEVKQTPQNTTIEYGSEDSLFCEVNAYPEAEIIWFHNETAVIPSDQFEIRPDTHSLLIKKMDLEDSGIYTCEIKTPIKTESFKSFVTISGLESPKVELTKSEITRKLGDELDLQCRIVKGKPSPTITWSYKTEDSFDFDDLPDGALAQDETLTISYVQTNHNGVYRCEASNILGHDSSKVILKVQYPPVIENSGMTNLTVKDGENVILPCKVSASPEASVRWEMSQDDVINDLDGRHITDDENTHRFTAFWNDSGNYHCIAENIVGRTEKTITVNVLVAPYIEAPKHSTVTVNVGDKLQLPCNILAGNPAPTLKWEFITNDFRAYVLKRDRSTSTLIINEVSTANEGRYHCIAENEIGLDVIKYNVNVQ